MVILLQLTQMPRRDEASSSAVFAGDSQWRVPKGKRMCSPGNSGKVDITRFSQATGDPILINVPTHTGM
ncbi:MAG: hypothetical protein WBC96_03210 [Thermodesulfobacteriota bacterium]